MSSVASSNPEGFHSTRRTDRRVTAIRYMYACKDWRSEPTHGCDCGDSDSDQLGNRCACTAFAAGCHTTPAISQAVFKTRNTRLRAFLPFSLMISDE